MKRKVKVETIMTNESTETKNWRGYIGCLILHLGKRRLKQWPKALSVFDKKFIRPII